MREGGGPSREVDRRCLGGCAWPAVAHLCGVEGWGRPMRWWGGLAGRQQGVWIFGRVGVEWSRLFGFDPGVGLGEVD